MTVPKPPLISPEQMHILRAVTAMAWADGVLEPAEVTLMADKLSHYFTADPEDQGDVAAEIEAYFQQQVPLAEILPQITRPQDRRLVLKLSYLVIAASARNPDEPLINPAEQAAFQDLVRQLQLPPEVVEEVANEVRAVSLLTDASPLDALVAGFTQHFAPST
jgi:uncharacterized membrane protein YebE (DUF533 family)